MATSVEQDLMSTGSDKIGSNVCQATCQPCLTVGDFNEAFGKCVDCDNFLCSTCYRTHLGHNLFQNHRLIEKRKVLDGQNRYVIKDECTEPCPGHEDEIIKHFCIKHDLLGCNVCLVSHPKECKTLQYIPRVAKDLDNNSEYQQAEKQLKSTINTLKNVTDSLKQNYSDLETSCSDAIQAIRNFRRELDEALGEIEAELVETAYDIQSDELAEMKAVLDVYEPILYDLQSSLTKTKTHRNARQHCSSFIEMMRTREKLVSLKPVVNDAEAQTSNTKRKIKFFANKTILDTLKKRNAFGYLSSSTQGNIVDATPAKEFTVKTGNDSKTCGIRGMAVLSYKRLVLTDYYNKNIKIVSIQSGQVLTQLKLSSPPWDLTATASNKVAVALPNENKLTMVTIGISSMDVERTIVVDGRCHGIDYKNDKLAVSYCSPHKVQVLSMQGSVLYDISAANLRYPHYLSYGHDDNTLFVSNWSAKTVDCMKLDGTVVATYKDVDLQGPEQLVIDSNGDLFVCAQNSHTIHQLSKDGKTGRVLLSDTAGLSSPYAMCLNERKGEMYVGLSKSDVVKVYQIKRV